MMTGQHFKELVETVCITLGISKMFLSECINVSKVTINLYEKHGLSERKKLRIMNKIRKFYLDELYNI